jgi:hypothetical protein
MRKNPGLPLSLLIIILLIAQQMFALHAPAQTGQPPKSLQDRFLTASNNVTERDVDSLIFDAVILDYDHPPFPRGTIIPLFGIKGGSAGTPEQGCPSIHYHSNPNLPSVRICRPSDGAGIKPASIVEEGPYRDQNPQGCGHGRIEKKQAALEIEVQGPSMAARASIVTYMAKVKNVGEVDFDQGILQILLDLDDGLFPIPINHPISTALRAGQEEEIPVNIDLLEIEEDDEFGGPFTVIHANVAALGILKDCRGEIPQIRASVRLTTNVLDAGSGPPPDYKREFGFGFNSTPEEFKVMPVYNGNMFTGLALFKDSGLSYFRSDSRGGFTIGVGPLIQGQVDNGAVDDFNRDGRSDIVAINNQSRSLSAFLQNNNGAFQPAKSSVTGIDFTKLVSADVNGDAAPDIVGADASGMMQVMRGDGQGGFTGLPAMSTGFDSSDAFIPGDFNGDEFADALVGANNPSGGSQIGVFMGDQDGNLGFSQFFTYAGSSLRVAAGDINGDGTDEIITAFGDTNTIDIRDAASGTVLFSFQSGDQPPVFVLATDLNGDGNSDVAVANQGSNLISIFLGDGSGNFFFGGNVQTPRPAGITSGDFNNDGNVNGQDLLVLRQGSGQSIPPFGEGPLATEADPDSAGVTIFLNGAASITRPVVEQVERRGKHLIVTCSDCAPGAKVLVDGAQKKTIPEPDGKLRAKKAFKQLAPGQSAVVQVESEGKFSEWFTFRRQD